MSIAVMHEVVHHLKHFERSDRRRRERLANLEESIGYSSWATFVSATAVTFAMRGDPLMTPPGTNKPPLCKGELGDPWVPYPRDHPSVFPRK